MSPEELARQLAAALAAQWGKVSVVVKDRDGRLVASLVVRADDDAPTSSSAAAPAPRSPP